METTMLITKWNGFLPVVEEMPMHDSVWDKIECFMDMVRTVGAKDKAIMGSTEV